MPYPARPSIDPPAFGVKSRDGKYIERLFAAPLFFLSTNNPSNILAASGGTQQGTITNPDPTGIAVITHVAFVSDGPFLIQLTPSDWSAALFTQAVDARTIPTYLDRPGELPRPIYINGAGNVLVNLTNAFGAVANNVSLTFWGYRKVPVSANC